MNRLIAALSLPGPDGRAPTVLRDDGRGSTGVVKPVRAMGQAADLGHSETTSSNAAVRRPRTDGTYRLPPGEPDAKGAWRRPLSSLCGGRGVRSLERGTPSQVLPHDADEGATSRLGLTAIIPRARESGRAGAIRPFAFPGTEAPDGRCALPEGELGEMDDRASSRAAVRRVWRGPRRPASVPRRCPRERPDDGRRPPRARSSSDSPPPRRSWPSAVAETAAVRVELAALRGELAAGRRPPGPPPLPRHDARRRSAAPSAGHAPRPPAARSPSPAPSPTARSELQAGNHGAVLFELERALREVRAER